MFFSSGRRWLRVGGGGLLAMAALTGLLGWLSMVGTEETAVAARPISPHGSALTETTYLPLVFRSPDPCYYTETDDAVVIEVESAPAVDDWELEAGFPGYAGGGYYVWRGPEFLGAPGNGILTYPISLTKSGTYQLNIRNSHPTNPSAFNDVWVRLDGGPWIKGFSNVIDQWTWDFNFDQGGSLGLAKFTGVTPGLHTLELSARSAGFRIDRIVLSTNGMGQLIDWPESPCLVP